MSQRGMTLLELLVALAIFAVVGTTLFPVINGALASRSAATERVEIDREARLVLDRLEQDIAGNIDAGLQGPVPPRFLAPVSPSRMGSGERVVLETTTVVSRGVTPADAFVGGEDIAALQVDRGDQAHVMWSFDTDGRLLRQEVRPPGIDPVDWTKVPVEVISERARLTLEFYEPDQWLDSWDSGEVGPHKGKAPLAVRTTVVIDDGSRSPLELVSTVVVPVVETPIDPKNPGAHH